MHFSTTEEPIPTDECIKVFYTLSDLSSCLPENTIAKMEMHNQSAESVTYRGIKFFLGDSAYQGQPREFYIRVPLDNDLPEWLCNLRCSVEAAAGGSGPIAGLEAILPQPNGPSYRRPPDYSLRIHIESDTWAGLKRICEVLDKCSGELRRGQ